MTAQGFTHGLLVFRSERGALRDAARALAAQGRTTRPAEIADLEQALPAALAGGAFPEETR